MESTCIFEILLARGWSSPDQRQDLREGMLQLEEDEEQKLWRYADLHQIWGVIDEGIRQSPEIRFPQETEKRFAAAAEKLAYQYYCMLSFTTYILNILKNNGIACYVLKGIPLNTLYPREEMRKLADADIYIPDYCQFLQAEKLMEAQGFCREKDLAEFHTVYAKRMNGRNCILELHWRPCEKLDDPDAERIAAEIFKKLEYRPDYCEVAGIMLPVLPATENAFQLLLHMLQHFLHEGFGLRLLCDWCVFWTKKGALVDDQKFLEYLQQAGLTGFAWAVTRSCIRHLKLDPGRTAWIEGIDSSLYGDSDEKLYRDILNGGEFGRGDDSRMVIFKKKSALLSAFCETHRIMRARFPELSKYILLWPLLWCRTVWIFLENTRKERKSSAGDIIGNARKRKKLLRQMKIFGNKG